MLRRTAVVSFKLPSVISFVSKGEVFKSKIMLLSGKAMLLSGKALKAGKCCLETGVKCSYRSYTILTKDPTKYKTALKGLFGGLITLRADDYIIRSYELQSSQIAISLIAEGCKNLSDNKSNDGKLIAMMQIREGLKLLDKRTERNNAWDCVKDLWEFGRDGVRDGVRDRVTKPIEELLNFTKKYLGPKQEGSPAKGGESPKQEDSVERMVTFLDVITSLEPRKKSSTEERVYQVLKSLDSKKEFLYGMPSKFWI